MSKTEAAKQIRKSYPGLLVRLRDGEFRITKRGLSPKRSEEVACYTEDAEDAINTAKRLVF